MDDTDQLIAAANPVPEGDDFAELAAMIAAARDESGTARSRRFRSAAAIGVATAVAFGGAGTAAAVTGWEPWAQNPDIVFSYTLPSGSICEQRMGNIMGPDPAAVEALRSYVADVDVLALADIDAALAGIRSEKNTVVLTDGTEVAGGYGTPYYDADKEYGVAISRAVDEVLMAELVREGFPLGTIDSWEGEIHCT